MEVGAESKPGEPEWKDAGDAEAPRWIYVKKTFDPDNANQVDGRSIVILQRGADGKLRGTDVVFSAN
jgi:hypothetical protein